MTTKPDQDKIYISLLGLAEHFRSTNPPDIKKCIQCLQALFTFMPPAKVVARTHLQMGQVLLDYTQSLDLARHHLEQAVSLYFQTIEYSVFSRKIISIETNYFAVASIRKHTKL